MTTPIIGAPDWAAAQASPWTQVNKAFRMIEAMARRGIIEDRNAGSPPASCADGACYLVAPGPSGAWVGQAGKLAVAVGTNAVSGWYFITVAVEGVKLWVRDENIEIRHNGTDWIEVDPFDIDLNSPASGDILRYDAAYGNWYNTGLPFELTIACSNESSALTASAPAVTFRMPRAVTLTEVRASLGSAGGSSGNQVQVDINQNGTSILSTKLTIDAGEKTSTTAAVPAVISTSALTDDAEMTIDIDDPGDGSVGLKVTLIGEYSS